MKQWEDVAKYLIFTTVINCLWLVLNIIQ